MYAARCFDLAIMRRRKLIDMSQDNLSSFRPRPGARLFVTLAMVQGADRAGRAGDAPRRADMGLVELDLTGGCI